MSKVSEWARLRAEIGSPYAISTGQFAVVTSDGHLSLYSDSICVSATPAEATAFARWILATFGEGAA